jgi:hypothetical protein
MWPSQVEFALVEAGAQSISPYNGAVESISYVAERWRMGITLPPALTKDGYARQAFLRKLGLGKNRVRLGPYLWGQNVPQGSLRGAPVLTSTAARGASTLIVTTAIGSTLKAGDFVGCGGQLFEVSDDCADSAGTMTIPVTNRVRANIGAGSAVTWSAPTAEFILPAASVPFINSRAILQSVTLDFIESWGIDFSVETGGVTYESDVFETGIYE